MNKFNKWISRILVMVMLASPFQMAQAAMIGTEQVASVAQLQVDRDRVANFLSRDEVAQQLQKFGVKSDSARDRVAAMSDDEVQKIASRIDSMPAGAHADAGWALLVIVVGILLWIRYR